MIVKAVAGFVQAEIYVEEDQKTFDLWHDLFLIVEWRDWD
jgi:hypothetical protein